jgi:hypothetical protein
LLSREQAAAELKRSISTVDNLNREGRLPYQHIGGKCIRVLRQDLEKLKAELAIDAESAGAPR